MNTNNQRRKRINKQLIEEGQGNYSRERLRLFGKKASFAGRPVFSPFLPGQASLPGHLCLRTSIIESDRIDQGHFSRIL